MEVVKRIDLPFNTVLALIRLDPFSSKGKHIVYEKDNPDAIIFEDDIDVDTDNCETKFEAVVTAVREYAMHNSLKFTESDHDRF